MHYILRAQQSKQRLTQTGQCGRHRPGPDDIAFRAEVGLTAGTTFHRLKGAIVGEEDFGPFELGPDKNLIAEEVGLGAIGYWCRLNEEGKRKKDEAEKKKEKEKEKEKSKEKEGEKEKGEKGEGSKGAANVGFGIAILGEHIGGANAGVGISVGSNSAAVGTAGAGISWFSDSAAAGAAGAGISKDSQAAGAAVVGAGKTEDTTAVGAAAAGAGRTSGDTSAGAGVAGAGTVEDSATAGAGTAGKGEVRDSMVAGAGQAASGKLEGAAGKAGGSPKEPIDPKDVTGPGADQVPLGQSDQEVMAKEGGTSGGTVAGGSGTKAGTRPGGGGAKAGSQPGGAGRGTGEPGGGRQTGVQQPGGGAGAPSAGQGDKAGMPGTPGGGSGSAKTQPRGDLGVMPVFPFGSSEKDKQMIAAEAAKVAAMLDQAQDAQKLLLQYLASQEKSQRYLVPTSEWVAKLLKVTEGLSPEDIEYLKQLDWKPGHVSEDELRERIRKALAERRPPSEGSGAGGEGKRAPERTDQPAPSGPGKGKGATGGGKQAGGEAHVAEKGQRPGAGVDRVTLPPPEAKHVVSGNFSFIMLSGMSPSSTLKQGASVKCTIRLTELDHARRTFILADVGITFWERVNDTTFKVYFTDDFWSDKYKFHGLGGKDTMTEYSFGGSRNPGRKTP